MPQLELPPYLQKKVSQSPTLAKESEFEKINLTGQQLLVLQTKKLWSHVRAVTAILIVADTRQHRLRKQGNHESVNVNR